MKKIRYPSIRLRTDAASIENRASRIRVNLLVFCLTFVPLDLLTSFAQVTYANTATKVQQAVPQDDALAPQEPNGPIKRQLLREEIGVIQEKRDDPNDGKLRQLIERIRSVRFGQEEKKLAAPALVSPKPPAAEPNERPLAAQPKPESPSQDAASSVPVEKVTDQTLQKLKSLAQQPGKVGAPLELGEVLFAAGCLQEAAAFYREALKRIDPNDPNAPNDRPWILFQIGNCLRDHDRPAAAKMYGQLLAEYPQSPWAELGKAESKLVEWYLKDDPLKLIEAWDPLAGK